MVGLLKSSSSLESSSVMLLDAHLKTKTFPFEASAEWYHFGSNSLTLSPKACCILGSLCRIGKSLGVSPMKIQRFCVFLVLKTLEVWMVLP